MRVLGIDVGRRRIGLAISDSTRTLARPLRTISVSNETEAVDRVADEVERLSAEDDGLGAVVVGMPVRLDGTPNEQSAQVAQFIDALRARTGLTVAAQDERLTSREAETRLALRERDWKERKKRLDAAAAAIILQDFLDAGRLGS